MKHMAKILAAQEFQQRYNPVESMLALEDLKITEEGIVDSIKNVIIGWREKRQDKRAEQAQKVSEITKVIKELQDDLADAKKKFASTSSQETSEVDISGVSGWFIDYKSKQVPKDLIARIEQDNKHISRDTDKSKKGHLDSGALAVDIYRHLDYSNDAKFTQTFIKRLAEVRAKSAIGVFPPDENSFYLGNVGAGTRGLLADLAKLPDVEWAAAVFRVSNRAMCTGLAKARGPEDKRVFKRSEVEQMIRIAEAAIKESADHYKEIGQNFNVDNTVFDWQVRAYYLQKEDIGFDGKAVDLQLDKTLKVLRDLIQFPAVMTADFLTLYLGILEHRYDTARYYTQLLRRMVGGLK